MSNAFDAKIFNLFAPYRAINLVIAETVPRWEQPATVGEATRNTAETDGKHQVNRPPNQDQGVPFSGTRVTLSAFR